MLVISLGKFFSLHILENHQHIRPGKLNQWEEEGYCFTALSCQQPFSKCASLFPLFLPHRSELIWSTWTLRKSPAWRNRRIVPLQLQFRRAKTSFQTSATMTRPTPMTLPWKWAWRVWSAGPHGLNFYAAWMSVFIHLTYIHNIHSFTASDKWRWQWETSWWSVRSATTCTTRTVTSPRWRIKTWTIPGLYGTAPAAPGKWSAWWGSTRWKSDPPVQALQMIIYVTPSVFSNIH